MKGLKKIFVSVLSLGITASLSSIGVSANSQDQDYDEIIDNIVEVSGMPVYAIENSINEIAEGEQIDKTVVAKALLQDMQNETISTEPRIETRASSSLPNSVLGDIWFSTATTSFYNHGHVGMYYTTSSIIEARGIDYKVAVRNCSDIPAKSGDQILAVSSIPNGTNRSAYRVRKAAVDWAYGKKGASYALTFNNKSCGNNDYNCSQLVWCAYNKTGDQKDLDSDGTWFVSPTDIKNSEWTFKVWSY